MLTQIIIITVVLLMFAAMFKELAHPSTIAFITLALFFILGYISTDEIMVAASNEGVLALAMLFIVASVVERTNLIERVLFYILDKSKSGRGALLRLMTSLVGFSAFFNNTPIVVMMVPAIQKWSKKEGVFASKYLIPVSYATIFGGMFTIIGTSSNLIVHGWLLEKGLEGFSFFQMFPYTIAGVVFGIIYLYTIGYNILPENDTGMGTRYEEDRKFLYEAHVEAGCNLIGKSVTSQEFKKLNGAYLIKIERGEETISPVRLEDTINKDDTLVFTGSMECLDSLEKVKHLSIKAGPDMKVKSLQSKETRLIEGLVSHNSSLIHKRVKDSNFRGKYDASIVAVHRKNEKVEENIANIRLKPGDVLLMLAGSDFKANAYKNNDFYILEDIPERKTYNKSQTIAAISGFVGMILLVATGVLSMFAAALLCIALFAVLDLFDPEHVKRSVSFQVLLLITSSLAIGKVIESSGTAELIAGSIIGLVGTSLGVIGLLAIVYIITNILTELITNTAAAVIVLPIAYEVSLYLELDPVLIAIIVAAAASASFTTPIGYQTNLIVYGPGGYKFSDYVRVGLPLNLIFMVTVIASVYFISIL